MRLLNLKNKYKKIVLTYVNRLNDMRFIGQQVFVLVVLLISWSGVKAIQTNYSLQKQITALKQQNSLQKLENENLNLQNQYYNSNQYLELSARENFGLAAAGEKEIIVPQQIALAHTIDLPGETDQDAASAKEPAQQRNFESWVDFFLHREQQ